MINKDIELKPAPDDDEKDEWVTVSAKVKVETSEVLKEVADLMQTTCSHLISEAINNFIYFSSLEKTQHGT